MFSIFRDHHRIVNYRFTLIFWRHMFQDKKIKYFDECKMEVMHCNIFANIKIHRFYVCFRSSLCLLFCFLKNVFNCNAFHFQIEISIFMKYHDWFLFYIDLSYFENLNSNILNIIQISDI